MRNLIDRENRARADALALIECGIRPKVARLILGNSVSLNECAYLFKMMTPWAQHERQGRVKFNVIGPITERTPKPSGYRSLTPTGAEFCVRAIALITQAVTMGATRADAIAATWRIESGKRDGPLHQEILGISAEDLAHIFINYQAAEIAIHQCEECDSTFFDRPKSVKQCFGCQTSRKARLKRAA